MTCVCSGVPIRGYKSKTMTGDDDEGKEEEVKLPRSAKKREKKKILN